MPIEKKRVDTWLCLASRGAQMSYQSARVKQSELNLMLPCAIFQFHSWVSCALNFCRLFKEKEKNPAAWLSASHKLLFRYVSSSWKLQRLICQTCILFLSFAFVFCSISCEAFVDESTLEHTLDPKIFVCHSAVRTKTVPDVDGASTHVCFTRRT